MRIKIILTLGAINFLTAAQGNSLEAIPPPPFNSFEEKKQLENVQNYEETKNLKNYQDAYQNFSLSKDFNIKTNNEKLRAIIKEWNAQKNCTNITLYKEENAENISIKELGKYLDNITKNNLWEQGINLIKNYSNTINSCIPDWDEYVLNFAKNLLNTKYKNESLQIIKNLSQKFPQTEGSILAYEYYTKNLQQPITSLWNTPREQALLFLQQNNYHPKVRKLSLQILGINEENISTYVNTYIKNDLESLYKTIEILNKAREYDIIIKIGEEILNNNNLQVSNNELKKMHEEFLFTLGKCYNMRMRYDDAIKIYKDILEKTQNPKTALQAKKRLATSYHYAGKYSDEIALLDSENSFQAFWAYYLNKDYANAKKIGAILLRNNKKEIPKIKYWLARIAEKEGKKQEALYNYKTLTFEFATSSYSIWARWRKNILEQKEAKVSPIFELPSNTPTSSSEYVKDYSSLNFRQSAAQATLRLNSPLEQIQTLSQITARIQQNPLLWTTAWPYAYPEIVQAAARDFSVSPFIILSIMRNESFYNPKAISPVNALGLLQVMPKTGNIIAKIVEAPEFQPMMLLEPSINVSIGSWYLQYLLSYYDNNFILASAAYNAGPEAVNRWIFTTSNLSLDEFAEDIPYDQTRLYVAKFIQNLNIYSLIYFNTPLHLHLPEKLPSPPKDILTF